MCLRSCPAHEQALADLLVVEPTGDQGHHLTLTLGQHGEVGALERLLGAAGELLDQPPSDTRRQQRVTGDDSTYGSQQFDGLGVLHEEAVRTGPYGFEHVLVEVERREDDDLHGRQPLVLGDPPRGHQAVNDRHANVHQDHIGIGLSSKAHRFFPVGCLANHGDVVLRVEQCTKAGADESLIVGDDDRDHGCLGRWAATRNPPPGRGPAVTDPPKAIARSRIPTMPFPPFGEPPTPSSSTSIVTPSSYSTRTDTSCAWAWRVMLVSASCTMRYAASSTADGNCCTGPSIFK